MMMKTQMSMQYTSNMDANLSAGNNQLSYRTDTT